MLIICDRSVISANNLVIITNDLLITAGRDFIPRTMNTRIIASNISDATIFAFCFIGNRICITDDFCIAAICDFIILASNIRVKFRSFFRIRTGNGIAIIIGYSIRQSYTGDASCEDEGGEGGDG